jgi:general secretion pathway protein K
MALISVLWGVGLLAAITLSFLSAGSTSYHLARNAVDAAQTDAAAEAAINRGVLALLDPRPETRWRTDGVPRAIDFDGVRMRVRIQDELGRIDLNNADGSLLIGLFQSVGLKAEAASALVDKILDWRDASNLKRLNGAKDPEYRAAGLAYRPRSGPFQSVDELKLVMDAPKVAALVGSRTGQPLVTSVPLIGRAFTITIDIDRPAGVQHREAVVRLTDHPQQVFWLLDWKSR